MRRARRSQAVRHRLLASFASLVSEKSYFDISVSDISAGAGLSTSSFYTYFDSKKELLGYYMRESLKLISGIIESLESSSPSPAILVRNLLYTLSTFADVQGLAAFYRVFREIEFIDTSLSREYYQSMLETIGRALTSNLEGLSGGEYWVLSSMMLGTAQFIHLFSTTLGMRREREPGIEAAGDLLLKGLSREEVEALDYSVPRVPKLADLINEYHLLDSIGDKVRRKLVEASIEVLSSKTFRATKVYEICDASGYAVGMFYKAYKSKNELLNDIVSLIGRTLRRYLTNCTRGAGSPVAAEVRGTACFLGFVERNAQIYRIVRESEYIDLDTAKGYYLRFREAYENRLSHELSKGKILTYNTRALATTLMGINHALGITGPILGITRDYKLILATLEKIYSKGILGIQDYE